MRNKRTVEGERELEGAFAWEGHALLAQQLGLLVWIEDLMMRHKAVLCDVHQELLFPKVLQEELCAYLR